MAMKPRRERIAYPIEFPPERLSHLTDKDWLDTPVPVRHEVARRITELELGLAIRIDRSFGRPKYSANGFYGLALAQQKLYRARRSGDAKASALAERRHAELVALLKDDIELLALVEKYGPVVRELSDLDLANYLKRNMEIEQQLKTDPTGAIFRICDEMGLDFLQVVHWASQQPSRGTVHAQ
jgi:hypothetical protein